MKDPSSVNVCLFGDVCLAPFLSLSISSPFNTVSCQMYLHPRSHSLMVPEHPGMGFDSLS